MTKKPPEPTQPTLPEPDNGNRPKAPIPHLPAALAPYAPRLAVRELALRITQMLPSAKELGPTGALALAQIALSLDLNPFTGEVWAWKNKDGSVSLMAGIKGLRRAARTQAGRDNGYYSVQFQMPTEDDLAGANIQEGDVVRACRLELWTDTTRETFRTTTKATAFYGIGIYRKGEPTRMEPAMVARKRAEADALKQAFDLPLTLGQIAPLPPLPPVHEPEPTPEPPKLPPRPHWIEHPDTRLLFWTWCSRNMALTAAEVHRALRVESVHDFPGTLAEAKAQIQAWVDFQLHTHRDEKEP